MAKLYKRNEQKEAQFDKKREIYKRNLFKAIVKLQKHFRDLGDSKPEATVKVNQLLESLPNETWLYSLGVFTSLQNGVNDSTLPFMNQAAKDVFLQNI